MQLTRGYISALIVTTSPINSYRDQQLQQWGWTNNPPIQVTTSNQIFNVTWSVTGSGSKFIDTSSGSHMHTSSLAWTESGSLLVQLQARMSASNQLVIDNSSPIVLAGGLRGTQQNVDDGIVTTTQLIAPVNGLPLPTLPWTGQQSARRLPDGSEQPTLASAAFPTKNRLGSLLGQALTLGNSYFGSQLQQNVTPGGTQAANATATATWSWRLYY